MSKSRMVLAAAVAALAVMLIGGAGPAAAQTSTTPLTKTVKMTGTAKNGKKFNGTYTIKRFTHSGSKLYAVGTLKGRLKGRRVTKNNVRIPASLARPASAVAAPADAERLPDPQPDAEADRPQPARAARRARAASICGSRASRAPAHLVGNLLCGITGILDPQAATPATPSLLTQVLNALLALVPRTA